MTTARELYAQLRGREAAESGPWAVPDRLILSSKVPRAARGTLPASERGHSQTSAAIVAALTDEPASGPGPNASRRPAAIHVPHLDAASAQALLRQPPLPRGATGDQDVLGVAATSSIVSEDAVVLRGERLSDAQLAAGGWHLSQLGWTRRVCYPVDEAESGTTTTLHDGDD